MGKSGKLKKMEAALCREKPAAIAARAATLFLCSAQKFA
jgi:hypothetical protein